MNIKDMIKNKVVTFSYYRQGELWYITECGFEFPVPIDDVGTASMNAEDKAILYMRWIRKEIARQEEFKKMRQESLTASNLTNKEIDAIKESKMDSKHNHLNDELK